jgi:hypothetical protein
MGNTITTPVEGSNVRQGANYVKDANGRVVVAGQTGTPLASPSPEQTGGAAVALGNTAPPEATPPPRELSLIEQFHPSLDPRKVEVSFENGRIKVAPRVFEEIGAEGAETDAGGELPELSAQHEAVPGGSEAQQAVAAPSVEMAELRAQVSQLKELLTATLQGKAPEAAAPAEPDYSEIDLYDPQTLAGFIKQNVRSAAQEVMAPYQQGNEHSRRQQEYHALAAQRGTEPDFQPKVLAAIELVRSNQALTVGQAYDVINSIAPILTPQQQAAPQPGAPKLATRTITQEQAEAKKAQAAKLPATSGVRGAANQQPPADIKDLGKLILWNLQQASQGN